jgi:hypothetical protein
MMMVAPRAAVLFTRDNLRMAAAELMLPHRIVQSVTCVFISLWLTAMRILTWFYILGCILSADSGLLSFKLLDFNSKEN